VMNRDSRPSSGSLEAEEGPCHRPVDVNERIRFDDEPRGPNMVPGLVSMDPRRGLGQQVRLENTGGVKHQRPRPRVFWADCEGYPAGVGPQSKAEGVRLREECSGLLPYKAAGVAAGTRKAQPLATWGFESGESFMPCQNFPRVSQLRTRVDGRWNVAVPCEGLRTCVAAYPLEGSSRRTEEGNANLRGTGEMGLPFVPHAQAEAHRGPTHYPGCDERAVRRAERKRRRQAVLSALEEQLAEVLDSE
jgi:hypothetical protein